METALPVAYNFSSHDMTTLTHRRMMGSHPDQGMTYYSSPALPYSASLPSSTFGFGHILNNHHPSYQNFFHPNAQVNPQLPRLSSESAPLQQLSDIRHVKNGISRLIKTTPSKDAASPRASPASQPSGTSEDGRQKLKPDVDFSTEVDTLMKAIQSKPSARPQADQHQLPPLQDFNANGPTWVHPTYPGSMAAPNQPLFPVTRTSTQKSRRKYECTLPDCKKSFFQKTHLDIHMRAHTGDKPFICKEPSCGQRFSQLGNLKTHERRHTGEKPFACEICHKTFAQRGNVRAHKITHAQAKPFTCRLDDCGKKFTQLGNLKSHQNKFHASTLRNLTERFAAVGDSERMSPQDRELWDYFSSLYKNSNKGIKGRGKDRRVSATTKRSASAEEDLKKSRARNYDEKSYTGAPNGDEVKYHVNMYHHDGSSQ